MAIEPDRIDIESVEREYGPLIAGATTEERAERYRLWQAAKLIRLWEQGKLPVEQMRALDALAAQKR